MGITIDYIIYFSLHSLRSQFRSRDTSPVRTAESSTQTDDVSGSLVDVGEVSEVKSKADLLEIEREMVRCW